MSNELLNEIGKLFIEWLNAHRNSYLYHKSFTDMLSKESKDDYSNCVEVLDEQPPDYNNTSWTEYQRKYYLESDKAKELYQQLIDKADSFIIQQNLGNLKWNY